MPYRHHDPASSHSGAHSDRKNGEEKRTFKLIHAAISISIAILLSALLLSFMLPGATS